MPGHGERLTRKQGEVILALLVHKTYADAASASGVSVRTIYTWLRRPDFVEAYRQARVRRVEAGLAELQNLVSDAVATLQRNLTCGIPAAENRAAALILAGSMKGIELTTVLEKVQELERLMKGDEGNGPASGDEADRTADADGEGDGPASGD